MVRFRPHKMRKVMLGAGSYDGNGDWVPLSNAGILAAEDDSPVVTERTEREVEISVYPVTDFIACRYEPNGAASTITLPDGNEFRYSYTIYLSVNPQLEIQYGDLIELVSQDGKFIANKPFEVRGFHRGQLDMKIWV